MLSSVLTILFSFLICSALLCSALQVINWLRLMRLGLFRCIDLSGNLLTDSSVQALSVLLAALPPAEYVRSAGSPLVVDFSSNEVLRVVYISTYLFNYLSSYLYIYLFIYLSE